MASLFFESLLFITSLNLILLFLQKRFVMTIRSYSKQDTSILKGFAILCICLHNFFHHLEPSTGENEFYFSIKHINNFFAQLSETPAEFVNTIFSFLGHYGVQIFIFISGYGLALSMLKNLKSWLNFVINRLVKLYPLLLSALIFFILFTIIMHDRFPWSVHYDEMKYKLLFIHTLLPNQGTSINGPWWFFGLIFQLYLIFPPLFHIIRKHGIKALVAICIFSYIWIFVSQYQFQDIHGVYLLQNFPGHLPEFSLGIYLALNKDKKINNIFFIMALILFSLGNFYKAFFPFTFLSITLIFIFAYQFFKNIPVKKTLLKRFLIHFGNISMSLFAVHGFIREPFIILADNSLNTPSAHLYAAFLFMATSYLLSFALSHLYELLLSLFNKIGLPKENRKSHKIISRILQVSIISLSIYIPYYYISQNKFDNAKQIVKQEHISDNFIVEKESVYNTFLNTAFEKNHKTIKIEGSMDIKNLKHAADIPPIVIEINGILWDKIDINKRFDNKDFNEFKFKYDYYVPFTNSLKNKTIKLYFWNTSKASIELKNINVSILAN